MHNGFLLNGTVNVIGSKLESELCKMVADVHSVGFDVRDGVNHQARNRDGSQDFCSRCELRLGKPCVVGQEGIGYKTLEALGGGVEVPE